MSLGNCHRDLDLSRLACASPIMSDANDRRGRTTSLKTAAAYAASSGRELGASAAAGELSADAGGGSLLSDIALAATTTASFAAVYHPM